MTPCAYLEKVTQSFPKRGLRAAVEDVAEELLLFLAINTGNAWGKTYHLLHPLVPVQ